MSITQLFNQPGSGVGPTAVDHDATTEETLFGFWLFLMSDLVLFSLLFATYAIMLPANAGGPTPKDIFDLKSAAIETGALLTSSFTFGMASLAMKYDQSRRLLLFWLAVTLLLGLTFISFEVRDFVTMVGEGAAATRSGFLSALFVLVATHGLHVTSGCIWIVVMMVQLMVFGTEREVKSRIMRFGMFWHFLDIIWVGIFSVVYLQGLS